MHFPVQVTEVKPTETFSQPEPQSSHDQEESKPKQEVEDPDVCSSTELKQKEDEEGAPARLYSDWTRGSVRRVTQQLEQRMKQSHETPPPSSPLPSLSGGTSGPQRRPNSVHSTSASPPHETLAVQQVAVVSGEHVKMGNARVNETGRTDTSTTEPKVQPADCRLLSTSTAFQHSAPSPFASVNFLCLEGVTELESGVDWDCFTEGPHSDIIMRDTWETLNELGVFLHQVGGNCRPRCVGSAQKGGSSFQKKVREVEARIRQAGLTPPSLMKRSASLAKLGCLELLANDLNERELSCAATAPPSAQAPVHTVGDKPKEQWVHGSFSSDGKQPEALETTANDQPKAAESSAEVSVPSNPSTQRGKLLNAGQDCLHSFGPTLLTTRQQYGRTHPLRQLKKRTVSSQYQYHTM